MALAVVAGLCAAQPSLAQTSITQNNLIQNGGFDSGGTSWSTSAGGSYFYAAGSDTIMSIGWWDGCTFWQNTGATIESGQSYVLTMRAKVGQSPLTGVNLSFQDVTAGWTTVTNQDFSFPDQTATWRIFSLFIDASTVSGLVGDTIGVGGRLNESPNTQYGWLWVDWVQLAPAIPYVTTQPQNATNFVGASASMSVAAIGAVTNDAGTLRYQWYKAPATLLANATNSSLTFSSLNTTNGGNYYVVVTGAYGSVQSSNATVNVLPANPPIVVTPPQSQSAYLHQSVQFTVTVSGTPPFSYQWKSNTVAMSGATNTTLKLANISAASAATYAVVITNAFGSATTNASLTVITPAAGTYEAAVIDLQPLLYLRFSDLDITNVTVNEGSLGAAADGTAEGSYYSNSGPVPPSYPNFEDTNRCVQLNGSDADVQVPPLNVGTNTGNTMTIAGWVTTYGTQLPYAGIIFERGGTGSAASGLDLHVNDQGQNVLAYHWANTYWDFDSGLMLSDNQWCFVALVVTPTNATLYLRDANGMTNAVNTAAHAPCAFGGNTYVGFDSNGTATERRFNGLIDEVMIFGRALSGTEVNELYSAAVGEPPGIVTQPAGLTNYTGLPFQLAVTASGAPPLQFQWRKDGTPLAGAATSSYSVLSAAVTNSGNYDVVIQNTAGSITSQVAAVSIRVSAPLFLVLPPSTNVWAGVPSTLAATVTGSAPLSYQWLKNNIVLTGQTNTTLLFPDPEAGDDADYVLRVTNANGQTNSPVAHLTVQDPARFPQMLYSTNTTGTWTMRSNFEPIQGVWFQTGIKNRLVTHLGYFDASGTGLLTNHDVGIYQGAPGSGALLASVQVPEGATAPYLSGFRWVALSAPFSLQANTNYVLAASENNVDPWPDAYVPQWNTAYLGATDGTTRYVMWDWPYQAWPHEPSNTGQGWGNNQTYGAFNLGSFPMVLSQTGGTSQLSWTLGTLQSSTNVLGPYTDLPGAPNPYTLPLTGPRQFYRLRYQ